MSFGAKSLSGLRIQKMGGHYFPGYPPFHVSRRMLLQDE